MKEIENKIKNINNKELSLGGFVALGIGACVVATNPIVLISAILTASISLPFFISGLSTKYKLNKKTYGALSGVNYFIYQKVITKWFDKYIGDSNSITEKKYKLLFLSIWLKENGIKMEDILGYNSEKINRITREILHTNNSKFNLYALVYEVNTTDRFDAYDILKEDINDNEKMAIAKKVYQDYSNNGLLGKTLKWWGLGTAETLLILQDYQINLKDAEEINKVIEKWKLNKFNFIDSKDWLYKEETKSLLNNLLDHQNGEKELIVLRDFFSGINKNYDFNNIEFSQQFQKKLDYINLKDKIEKTLSNKEEKKTHKSKL